MKRLLLGLVALATHHNHSAEQDGDDRTNQANRS